MIVGPIIGLYFFNQVRINAFQAAQVYPVLIWIGSSFVVCIDATYRTEVVFRFFGVKLIEVQFVFAANYLKSG